MTEHPDYSFLEQELAKLNAEQRKAVDTLEGPVLVVAGPGTGKTAILSARVGQLLRLTDAKAENILCLTYTEMAAQNMRERLKALIGPAAHKVQIHTFHSFCHSLIQENLLLFGRRELEPIDDLGRIQVMRQLIDELPDDHVLRPIKGDSYLYESHLLGLFDMIKGENWDLEYIEKSIEEYMASLPKRKAYIYQRKGKGFVKGDVKTGQIKIAADKMEKLRAAARLFPTYENLLLENQYYDFADMIRWILREFKKPESELLRDYQDRIHFLLVDEFQDTSGAQNEILKLLCNSWEVPNLFVVGDDDQSIFEFQGARLKNILDFASDHGQKLEKIVLKKNYRSSQNILDYAHRLIDYNEERLSKKDPDIIKLIEAANDAYAECKQEPQIVNYATAFHEAVDIVNQIELLRDNGTKLSEIAIIYSRHRQADLLLKLFESKDIPYKTRKPFNILDLPLVQNIVKIIRYLKMETEKPHSGEKELFEIMHYNFYAVPPADLARISVFLSNDKRKKFEQKEFDNILFLRELINDTELLGTLKLKNLEAVIKMADSLEKLIIGSRNQPMPVLFSRILNGSGLLNYIDKHADKVHLLQVVYTFYDFLRKEALRNPRLRTAGLLNKLQTMDKNNLSMGLLRIVAAEDGVSMLTAHSAKGLEFEHVFMIDCSKKTWEGSKGGMRRFSLPDTLTYSGKEDATEARRRLFYVGLTRAKTHIQISFNSSDGGMIDVERTCFIDELLPHPGAVVQKKIGIEMVASAQISLLKTNDKPVLPRLNKAILDQLLQGFTMSATALCRFLYCPLGFYYENVLRVPSPPSAAAAFGSAIHEALRRLFWRMERHPDKQFPDAETLLNDFRQEFERHQPFLTVKHYKERLAMGERLLAPYLEARRNEWHKEARTEAYISTSYKGVPIKGSIDKIELIDKDTHRIVDYKSGSHKKERSDAPTAKRPLGGDYWRQILFYTIMLETAEPEANVKGGFIDYIMPDAKGKYILKEIPVNAKHRETVGQQIVDVYTKIQNHDFFEGCGKKECSWCNFAHKNISSEYYGDEFLDGII